MTNPAIAAAVAAVKPQVDPDRIVARPLSDPEFMNVRPKEKGMSLYWANRLYENGHRVDYRLAQGFEFAKPEDVEGLPTSLVRDGKIVYGDLVLMKLPKNLYYGALLNNHNKAVRRLQKKGIKANGEQMLTEELTSVPGKRSDKAKIVVYAPSDPKEIQQMVKEGRL